MARGLKGCKPSLPMPVVVVIRHEGTDVTRRPSVPSHRQLCALTHSLLDADPQLGSDASEIVDRLKHQCAQLRFVYDSSRLWRVVEAVTFVRRRRHDWVARDTYGYEGTQRD